MKHLWIWLTLTFFLLTACSEDVSQQKLVLTGSSTIAPLVGEIAKRFETLHPEVRIDVQTGGSSRGIVDARQGLADIGMASRVLKADEGDLVASTIALDGISLIVHKDNPVSTLSDAQVVDIYTGKITNWKEAGGNDAPITVVNRADGRSEVELFLPHFKIEGSAVKAQVIVGENQQGIKTVAGNPNAITYMSIGSSEADIKSGVPIKLLPIGGISASTETVQNGSFPLARPLNLVTKAEPQGLVKDFIDYARSEAVHDIVKDQYFVTVKK